MKYVLVKNYFYLLYVDAFFFFQAEDGIRDATVTGVQTCALPILELVAPHFVLEEQPERLDELHLHLLRQPADVVVRLDLRGHAVPAVSGLDHVRRSEERRVGKECRSRGVRDR